MRELRMGLRKSRTFTGAGGENAIVELIMATHAGMTMEQFEKIVKGWIGSAKNPKTDRLVAEMIYEPMLKLLAYLRANGFKIFIVSLKEWDLLKP